MPPPPRPPKSSLTPIPPFWVASACAGGCRCSRRVSGVVGLGVKAVGKGHFASDRTRSFKIVLIDEFDDMPVTTPAPGVEPCLLVAFPRPSRRNQPVREKHLDNETCVIRNCQICSQAHISERGRGRESQGERQRSCT